MNSSKDSIDESKHSELQNTSTLKLDRNHLLENERYIMDYSELHDRVLALVSKKEIMIDDVIKVIIVDACQ